MSNSTTKPTDIIVIVDESGSMTSMGKEPVQAVNAFIKEQKEALDDDSTFTLYKFGSKVTCVYDDIPQKDVSEFTDYMPDSLTALCDAIGTAITTKKKKERFDNVVCVIVTDGLENASAEFTTAQIKKMSTEMETKHNWKFVYLGANQDAFAAGNQYTSSAVCAAFDATPAGLSNAAKSASQAVAGYRMASVTNPKATIQLGKIESTRSVPTKSPTRVYPGTPYTPRLSRGNAM